jgi:hypothetical protein
VYKQIQNRVSSIGLGFVKRLGQITAHVKLAHGMAASTGADQHSELKEALPPVPYQNDDSQGSVNVPIHPRVLEGVEYQIPKVCLCKRSQNPS